MNSISRLLLSDFLINRWRFKSSFRRLFNDKVFLVRGSVRRNIIVVICILLIQRNTVVLAVAGASDLDPNEGNSHANEQASHVGSDASSNTDKDWHDDGHDQMRNHVCDAVHLAVVVMPVGRMTRGTTMRTTKRRIVDRRSSMVAWSNVAWLNMVRTVVDTTSAGTAFVAALWFAGFVHRVLKSAKLIFNDVPPLAEHWPVLALLLFFGLNFRRVGLPLDFSDEQTAGYILENGNADELRGDTLALQSANSKVHNEEFISIFADGLCRVERKHHLSDAERSAIGVAL